VMSAGPTCSPVTIRLNSRVYSMTACNGKVLSLADPSLVDHAHGVVSVPGKYAGGAFLHNRNGAALPTMRSIKKQDEFVHS